MTSSSVALTGSIVALITPMHEDGSVDYPALRKLIDWHIAEGTDCIGVVGTTGEKLMLARSGIYSVWRLAQSRVRERRRISEK